jgi:hypothetical protein
MHRTPSSRTLIQALSTEVGCCDPDGGLAVNLVARVEGSSLFLDQFYLRRAGGLGPKPQGALI